MSNYWKCPTCGDPIPFGELAHDHPVHEFAGIPIPKPPLLPDDDTAVERLRDAIRKATHPIWGKDDVIGYTQPDAEEVIAALREGGQRE